MGSGRTRARTGKRVADSGATDDRPAATAGAPEKRPERESARVKRRVAKGSGELRTPAAEAKAAAGSRASDQRQHQQGAAPAAGARQRRGREARPCPTAAGTERDTECLEAVRSERKRSSADASVGSEGTAPKRMRRFRQRGRQQRSDDPDDQDGVDFESGLAGSDNFSMEEVRPDEVSRRHRAYHSASSYPPRRGDEPGSGGVSVRVSDTSASSRRRGAQTASSLPMEGETPAGLQGLLRRLGAGLDEMFPSFANSSQSRLRRLAAELRRVSASSPEAADVTLLLQTLTELCEILSVGTEDLALGFSSDQLVSPLVWVLQNFPTVPDLLILAARALAYLIEVSPSTGAAIAQSRAVSALCASLLNIEYIDLAEQSLQALERLSHDYPHQVIRSGGLRAVLQYIDFFPSGVQRIAASAAANLCCRANDSTFGSVVESLELLSQLLENSDTRVRESGLLAYSRLALSYRSNALAEPKLRQVATAGDAIARIAALLSTGPAAVDTRHKAMALRTLACFAEACPSLRTRMLQSADEDAHGMDMPRVLQRLLGRRGELQQQQQSRSARSPDRLSPVASDERARIVEALAADALALVDALAPNTALVMGLAATLDACVRSPSSSSSTQERRRHAVSAIVKTLRQLQEPREVSTAARLFMPLVASVLSEPVDDRELAVAVEIARELLTKADADSEVYSLLVKQGVLYELQRCREAHTTARRLLDEFGERLQRVGEESLRALQRIGRRLESGDASVLPELARRVSSVSTFELQRSRIVEALDAFLSADTGALGDLARRYAHTLVHLYQPTAATATEQPFAALVKQAVAAFSHQERLETVLNGSGNGSISSGIRLLAQPFRLRLSLDTTMARSPRLREFPPSIVLIEPLATAQSIEEFLVPRVTTGHSSSSPMDIGIEQETLFEASDEYSEGEDEEDEDEEEASSMNDDDDDDDDDDEDEEEDDEDASDDENAEHLDSEADEVEQLGPEHGLENPVLSTSLPAVDIHVEASPSGGSRGAADSRRRGSRALRAKPHAESYAARAGHRGPPSGARASRHAPSRGDDRRPPSSSSSPTTAAAAAADLRLRLTLRAHPLAPTETILHAVAAQAGGGSTLGPRLWAEMHELLYGEMPSASTTADAASMEELPSGGLSSGDGMPAGNAFQQLRVVYETLDLPQVHVRFPVRVQTPSGDNGGLAACLSLLSKLYWLNHHHSEVAAATRALRHHEDSATATATAVEETLAHLPPAEEPLLHDATVFVSAKLDAKLRQQLGDPLAVAAAMLPSWCFGIPLVCPPLVSLETRRLLVQVSAFGIARALSALQARADALQLQHGAGRPAAALPAHAAAVGAGALEQEARVGRIQRQKVRVQRAQVLESARAIMDKFADQKSMIEVEYFDEAGTGLGPTLEFYALVSRELHRADLGLWWEDSSKAAERQRLLRRLQERAAAVAGGSDLSSTAASSSSHEWLHESELAHYVAPTGCGLFPAPIGLHESGPVVERRLALFRFVGTFCAKALLDGRLLDLHFSPAFWRVVAALRDALRSAPSRRRVRYRSLMRAAKQAMDFTPARLLEVDTEFARSMHSIALMADAADEDVEALGLDFTLPGAPQVELKRHGRRLPVTRGNLAEYCVLVTEHVLFDGAVRAAYAFVQGFQRVCCVDALVGVFGLDEEVNVILSGPQMETWDESDLLAAFRFDHGYSRDSPVVLHFVRALCSLEEDDKRRFLLFATGSPRLPVGGFHALLPKMTIVRRSPESGLEADDCLPTVMTCTNYLKLPEYSSYEVLWERLLYTIREGQNSFDLS